MFHTENVGELWIGSRLGPPPRQIRNPRHLGALNACFGCQKTSILMENIIKTTNTDIFQNTLLSCRPCSCYNFLIWMVRKTPRISLDPPYRKPCSDRRSWYMNRGMRRESPETTFFLKKPHVKLQTHFSRYWASFGSWKYAQMKARLILRRLAWVSPPGADFRHFLIFENRMSEIWKFWIFESRFGAEAQGYLS